MLSRILFQFQQYLMEKDNNNGENDETQDYSDVSAVSIFSKYASEFKDYVQENSLDETSIFDGEMLQGGLNAVFNKEIDLSVFDDVQFEDGYFVVPGDDTENNDNKNVFLDLLNSLAGNKEFKSAMDKNSDSDISSEEISDFFSELAGEGNKRISLDTTFDLSSVNQNQKSISCNLPSVRNLNVELSDTDISVINKLFGLDSDEKSLSQKQKQAENLIGSMIDDKSGLTSDKVKLLQNYISKLSALNLSADEIVQNIKSLDGNPEDVSTDDLKMLAAHLQDGTLPQTIEEALEAGIEPNSAQTQPTGGNGPKSPASSQKKVSNMSIDELKSELESAKAAYSDAISSVNAELAQRKSTAESNLETAKQESKSCEDSINSNKLKIVYNESLITSNNAEIENLQSQLSNLSSETEEGSEENAAVDSASIQSQINSLISANEKLQSEIDALNEENAELEQKKTEQDLLVSQYTQELSEIETEINSILTTNPEVAEAKAYLDEVQAVYDKRSAEKEAADKVEILDVTKNAKDLRNSDDLSNLPLTYELDGKTYYCPKFASYDTDGDGIDDFTMDSWEEFQRYALNAGICNVGAYGSMQCQNAAAWYMEFALGVSHISIVNEMKDETEDPEYGNKDTAGFMTTQIGEEEGKNQRYITQVKGNRDETYEVIVNELKNGRPCVVSVPGSSSHYILAMGLSEDGDILVMDSYNCSIQKLGYANSEAYAKGDKQHRNLANYNGAMIFSYGHTLRYGNRGDYMTKDEYWDTCGQDVEYRTYLSILHANDIDFVKRQYPELFEKYGNL